MKLEQTQMVFNPIRILLETREEANAFLTLIDDLEEMPGRFTYEQNELILKISNAFTNMDVQI